MTQRSTTTQTLSAALFLGASMIATGAFATSAPSAQFDQSIVQKSCPNGEKWDATKKKCVNDPFTGGY
ncbi:MAG: hypothetical protein AAGJ70_00645 [Pseudomonadota bacterium]